MLAADNINARLLKGTVCVLMLTLCGCYSARRFSPWRFGDAAHELRQEAGMGRSISQLQSQLERTDDAPELNVELGKLFLESGQLLPAMRQVELALQQESKLAGAWVLRGDIEMTKMKYSAALASYQHAIRLDGDEANLLRSVASCYLKQGRPLRAAATLENMMQQYGDENPPVDLMSLYGSVMREVGQFSQATFAFARVCEDKEAAPESFVELSEVQSLAGDHEASFETLRVGLQRFPESELMQQSLDRFAQGNESLAIR